MIDLVSATVCIKRLEDEGVYTCSKSYFSQLVAAGRFPVHKKANSPKDWFKYDEVKEIVKSFSSAEESTKRIEQNTQEDTLLSLAGSYPSQADMTESELKVKIQKEREDLEFAKRQALAAGANADEEDKPNVHETEILGMSLNQVKIQKEYWLGKKAEIEYKRQMGEVVSIDEVNKNAFEIARMVRDNLLGISARLTPALASESDHYVIRTLIDEEIGRALKSISEVVYE